VRVCFGEGRDKYKSKLVWVREALLVRGFDALLSQKLEMACVMALAWRWE
jgi:hypothetical protein